MDDERYVTLELIRDSILTDGTVEGALAYIEAHGLRPATCSVCEGEIPEDATLPLCKRCRSTAEATARAFPEGPEGFARASLSRMEGTGNA
jgi:hypothetical protein